MSKVIARGYRNWNLRYVHIRVTTYDSATDRHVYFNRVTRVECTPTGYVLLTKKGKFTVPGSYELDLVHTIYK